MNFQQIILFGFEKAKANLIIPHRSRKDNNLPKFVCPKSVIRPRFSGVTGDDIDKKSYFQFQHFYSL